METLGPKLFLQLIDDNKNTAHFNFEPILILTWTFRKKHLKSIREG
jgi:hypothetical protein